MISCCSVVVFDILQDRFMMSQRIRDTINTDPELEECKNNYHKDLRGGCFKIRFTENILKCPFCPDSRYYSYDDILRHANRIVRESKSASFKEIAKHMGLVEYLERDFHATIKCSDSTSINASPKQNADEELIVWPWMAVVANIAVEYKNGRYAGDSGKKLKEDWTEKGYKPVKVHPLWNWRGHSGLAVAEFGKTWDGLYDKLYAWIATDEDYNSHGLVGDYLRKISDLKTVGDVQKEDEVKKSKLIQLLKTVIDEKDKRSEEMNSEISKTDIQLKIVMKQKEEITENFNRDMETMQKRADNQLKMVTTEHERSKWLLEDREKELRAREARNETEERKLDYEKRMNELAIHEQIKADERVLKLAEDQKVY
ncbi:hypothetical protein L1987_29616 [Smallanthus sonchifolius]|uniref:Uncharacterized protein n=1 Tax=Smallanthus sonchifolius TaxID=185202 RepID=A0ACB9I0H0_9ASTR|nr:hypothetical protein L1987_29616 [Smallanthus sonchifolius]